MTQHATSHAAPAAGLEPAGAFCHFLPQIVWVCDADGVLQYVNRRWTEYTGLSLEETRGGGVNRVIHPDDQRRGREAWERALRSGTPFECEYRFLRAADGAHRWHLARCLPVHDASGRVVQWIGTSTDIDDQKRAEHTVRFLTEALEQRVQERTRELAATNEALRAENRERRRAQEELRQATDQLRLLLESSGEGICGIDEEGRCVFLNPAGSALLGWRSDEIMGRTMHEVCHHRRADGSPYPADDCPVRQAFHAGAALRTSEEVFWRKDGTSFPVELTSQPLLVGGAIRGAVITFADITARRRAEEEVRKAREAAEAANAAKGRFLANMSHEIRTPLNGILGLTGLVLDTPLSAEQREHLRLVKSSADALLGIINDILDFSKIEAGKLELEAVDFDLRRTAADTVRALEVRAREKGLSLRLDVAPDVPDRLVGDPGRLRQVLLNLAGNAVKFTQRGEVVVAVSSAPGAGGADAAMLQFSVRDTGVGIPADKLGAIFQPFVQADGSTTRTFGGTGLGLSITSQLVGMMGGGVWVESEPGKGSVFHFTARFGRGKSAETARPAAAAAAGGSGRALRILLAEDNSVNQRVAVRLLEKQGHAVVVAGDGAEAAAAEGRGRFDLILMDVEMPRMDGFEATAAIRDRERTAGGRTPIIAMTAHAMKGDRERCLDAGMDGYVTKPIEAAALHRAIRDVLNGPAPARRVAGEALACAAAW